MSKSSWSGGSVINFMVNLPWIRRKGGPLKDNYMWVLVNKNMLSCGDCPKRLRFVFMAHLSWVFVEWNSRFVWGQADLAQKRVSLLQMKFLVHVEWRPLIFCFTHQSIKISGGWESKGRNPLNNVGMKSLKLCGQSQIVGDGACNLIGILLLFLFYIQTTTVCNRIDSRDPYHENNKL